MPDPPLRKERRQQIGEDVELLHRQADLDSPRQLYRHPHFRDDDCGEFIALRDKRFVAALQQPGPFIDRCRRPGRKSPPRSTDGHLHINVVGIRDKPDDLFRKRVGNFDSPAGYRLHPTAIDIQLIMVTHRPSIRSV
jgi:hypothetical protein